MCLRKQTNDALDYSRKGSRPCMIIWNGLPRRFGHAATDRQNAYLTEDQIKAVARRNPVEYMCAQLVELGVITYPELEQKYLEIWDKVLHVSFTASNIIRLRKLSPKQLRNQR